MEFAHVGTVIEAIQSILGDKTVCLENEPMSRHTTFRAGGPARIYVPVPECEEHYETVLELFVYLRKQSREEDGLPFYVLGRGSNLLVSDAGYEGIIVDMSKGLQQIRFTGEQVTAQAGVTLARLAQEAMKQELSGLEFASGIPGTLGGAVAMNAGAYGGEMKDVVVEARVLSFGEDDMPKLVTLTNEELKLQYRNSRILAEHEILLEVTMQLESANGCLIADTMEELKRRRMEKQPLDYPSAGSTFKRPEGYFAGKLIMDAGLAGYSVGGAMVSPKHCGFIVNYDHATASDIYQLCQDVKTKVCEKFGVQLEMEVKLLGDFEV